ncbi:D-alanine--D-alanine ligase [Clostridium sp. 'White wine YQ']|uniref:D-alanine--D-alanine ligase n=1 Tax=Clostridium sp. 'White wine YQ' TaxID=3027474 RepID=UPI0023668C68|nr:D-alanine--D-alanine ligase [Clostridium sp. 'White wine YQ']MDD7792810.1 D-alanine--D-alanine ligase [Clostridium sp. 'White wine YQ']
MKVGVIMGGVSSERDISIASGNSVVENLDKNKYEVVPILLNSKEELVEKVKGIDFALLALHGKFGEDGAVQAVLETLGIPYSGCGIMSSSVCMDKDMTKKVLKACDIRTARWFNVSSIEEINYEVIEEFGYPVVVKPNSGGSSVATFVVNDKDSIEGCVAEALKWDSEVMIEEYIKGDEITCPVIDGKLYPIIAIKPKSSFFDYASKYSDGGADEFVVELEEELYTEVQKMAFATYKALKCSVYARVDMIVKEGVPYILEVNTLPGMTKNSLIPKSAAGINIEFNELLDIIIDKSLKVSRN